MKNTKQYRQRYLLALNQWLRLAQEIAPNKKVENPYQAQTEQLLQHLDILEQYLFLDIIHVITRLNISSREKGRASLITTLSDIQNAYRLIQKEEKLSKSIHIEKLEILRKHFKHETFTYQQAMLKTGIAFTTLKRYIHDLKLQKLVEKVHIPNSRLAHFRIIKQNNPIPEQEQSIFEQVFSDFEDYKVFTDLRTRTDSSYLDL